MHALRNLRHAFLILPVGLLLTVAPAQITTKPPVSAGNYGFQANDGTSSAGVLCSAAFTCTPGSMTTATGNTLTLTVRAPQKTNYLILIGNLHSRCVTLPGFDHMWVVAPVVIAPATCNQNDTIRCWGGVGTTAVKVPTTLPKGFRVSFQALLHASNTKNQVGPVFTGAVTVSI